MFDAAHVRCLFITKRRTTHYGELKSSGLLNSAQMIVDAFMRVGVWAKLVDAVDGNDIDRVVTQYRPTHVVLEAFWCPPEKLAEVQRLHPTVQWTVRNHSKIPFLAGEGIAFNWARRYASEVAAKYTLSSNSTEAMSALSALDVSCIPLHNIYSGTALVAKHAHKGPYLDVGCFGAIRLLKNQTQQAIAALNAARALRKKLRFHINTERQEMGGMEPYKNIVAIFDGRTDAELVLHPWHDKAAFQEALREMDIVMQASYSETFCIVAADAIMAGVPVVGCPDIEWLPETLRADPNSLSSISRAIVYAYNADRTHLLKHCVDGLHEHNEKAARDWLAWLGIPEPKHGACDTFKRWLTHVLHLA